MEMENKSFWWGEKTNRTKPVDRKNNTEFSNNWLRSRGFFISDHDDYVYTEDLKDLNSHIDIILDIEQPKYSGIHIFSWEPYNHKVYRGDITSKETLFKLLDIMCPEVKQKFIEDVKLKTGNKKKLNKRTNNETI